MTNLLDSKRHLLFLMSLCVTVGGWILTLPSWTDACTTASVGGLLVLLGNNVFANLIKNIWGSSDGPSGP